MARLLPAKVRMLTPVSPPLRALFQVPDAARSVHRTPRGRRREAARSADPRARQADGSIWRDIPAHRHPTVELHQLRQARSTFSLSTKR